MKKISIFVFNRILGLFFLVFFGFALLSLVYYSPNDNSYSYISSNETFNNIFGTYGAFFSSVVYGYYGYLAYIWLIFFLVVGFKRTFLININYLIIRFFSFAISSILFCWLFNDLLNYKTIIGDILSQIVEIQIIRFISNDYLIMLFYILLTSISIIFFIFGTSIKIKTIRKFIYPLYKIIFYFLGLLKFIKLNSLIKKQSKKEDLTSSEIMSQDSSYSPLKRTKQEPVLGMGLFSKKILKKNLNKIDSNNDVSTDYKIPVLSLLLTSTENTSVIKETEKRNQENAIRLEKTLSDFGVTGKVTGFKTGPIVTLFEFLPSAGIKSSKIIGLANDIARSMSSISARVSSQPGKNAIGIEIPNSKKQNVLLGDLLNDDLFTHSNKGLVLALGKNISGEKIFTDLERMPHLLIAGTTGSGKSVGINSMILSLLFKFKPSECKFILIDPKMLELSIYENIPHLLTPVVTDPKKAVSALKWVVKEMENRYRLMSSTSVKNITSFNKKISEYFSSGKKLYREVQTGIDQETNLPIIEKKEIPLDPMPLIVVVIDEMADLMMVAGKEVEHSVQRLAQMARASGIHLIAATQRPSVDVITGTIKANFPSRISYRVASKFDSRTILNEMGAEQLLGSGDMLFLENAAHLIRLHGGFVSEKEIEKVVNFINSQPTNEIRKDITDEMVLNTDELNLIDEAGEIDVLYNQAVSIVIGQQKASTSFLQRHLQIGYNRAARMIEQMEREGIISESNHVGKRNVLKKNK